jgi:membrane fusion protein, heavy metal efflux system
LADSGVKYLADSAAKLLLAAILLAIAFAAGAQGSAAPAQAARQTAPMMPSLATPLGCLIEPDRIADVGSPVAGVIERVEVERGQSVARGQVIAVLRASVEQASLNVAISRAESAAEELSAVASMRFNRERLERAEGLFKENFISQQALDQARAEAQLAVQKLEMVREQRALQVQERDVVAAQLAQRTIRSPINGVVAERFMSAGERVDERPVVRLATIDPLKVQLVVPVSLFPQIQVGTRATVTPELPGAKAMDARVSMVDKVVDAASNTFRVHLSLPNPRGALPAGLRCKAQFAPAAAAAPMPVLLPVSAPAAGAKPATTPQQ